jgi:hypothetical protein
MAATDTTMQDTPTQEKAATPEPEQEKQQDEAGEKDENNELVQSNKYLDGLIYPPPEIRSMSTTVHIH